MAHKTKQYKPEAKRSFFFLIDSHKFIIKVYEKPKKADKNNGINRKPQQKHPLGMVNKLLWDLEFTWNFNH